MNEIKEIKYFPVLAGYACNPLKNLWRSPDPTFKTSDIAYGHT